MTSIVYVPRRRRRGQVVIPNETVYDERLSCRSLGLLVALLGRPHGARMDMTDLARARGHEGRDALRSALAELRGAGYVHQFTRRGEAGRLVTVTVVDDRPMASEVLAEAEADAGPPGPENPSPVPGPENPSPVRGLENRRPVDRGSVDPALSLREPTHLLRDETSTTASGLPAAPSSPLSWSPDGRHRVCDTVHSEAQRCPRLNGPPPGWRQQALATSSPAGDP